MPVSSPAQSRCSEHPASLCHQSSPLSAPGAPEAITGFEFHGQVDARRCAERFTEMNLCSHVREASAVKIPISQMRTRAQRGAGSCPRPHSRGEELSWKPAPSDLLFSVSFLSLCWVGGGTEDPHLPSLRLSTHPFPQGWFSPPPFISVPGEVRAGLVAVGETRERTPVPLVCAPLATHPYLPAHRKPWFLTPAWCSDTLRASEKLAISPHPHLHARKVCVIQQIKTSEP